MTTKATKILKSKYYLVKAGKVYLGLGEFDSEDMAWCSMFDFNVDKLHRMSKFDEFSVASGRLLMSVINIITIVEGNPLEVK